MGVSALGVWISPHMGWSAVVPQPAAAALAVVLWLLCWALPWTFVYLLSLSLWGLTLYASWQAPQAHRSTPHAHRSAAQAQRKRKRSAPQAQRTALSCTHVAAAPHVPVASHLTRRLVSILAGRRGRRGAAASLLVPSSTGT